VFLEALVVTEDGQQKSLAVDGLPQQRMQALFSFLVWRAPSLEPAFQAAWACLRLKQTKQPLAPNE
jgi:hypothetical protein